MAQKLHAFPFLDALRGVAAISVVIYHYSMYLSEPPAPYLPNAFLAVDFFFVLSGFVIGHAYENRLRSGQTVGQFMLRRFIRLYPLYLLGVTVPLVMIGLAMLVMKSYGGIFSLLYLYTLGASLLPASSPGALSAHQTAAFPLNVASWSLSLEIGVNFIYALFCRQLTTKRLIILCLLSGLLLGVAYTFYGQANMGWEWPTYAGGWVRAFWSFFVGILLYRLFAAKNHKQLPAATGLLLAIILLAIFANPFAWLGWNFVGCILLFPLIVWMGANTETWIPANRFCAWLGRISYVIYIMHVPLFAILTGILKRANIDPQANVPLAVTLEAIVLLIVVSAVDIIYDIPMRAWLERKFVRPSTAKL